LVGYKTFQGKREI